MAVVKLIIPEATLLHRYTFAGWLTWAVGLTVIVNVFVGPGQFTTPSEKCGVTTIEATMGAVVVFRGVNDNMFPEPVAARPIPEAELVQVKYVDPFNEVKITSSVATL